MNCTQESNFITCFELSFIFRLSGSLVYFFQIMFFLTLCSTNYNIYINENLWVLKFFSFFLLVSMNILSHHNYWVYYGIVAKYISLVFFLVMNIQINDILYIIAEWHVIPQMTESQKCKLFVTLFYYVFPGLATIGLFVYNFAVNSGVCSEFLGMNIIALFLLVFYVQISLIKPNRAKTIFNSLWMTFLLATQNYGILSASPLTNCYVTNYNQIKGSNIKDENSVLDTVFSSLYVVIVLLFISFYSKKTVKTQENHINYWLMEKLLCEPGPLYITIGDEDKKQIMREALIELKEENPGILQRENEYMRSEYNRGVFLKNERKKAGLKAITTYQLKHPYADGNRYKSKQTAWFHLFMVFVGFYYSVTFGSWITLTPNDTSTQLNDDTAVWVRFAAFIVVIILLIINQIVRTMKNNRG